MSFTVGSGSGSGVEEEIGGVEGFSELELELGGVWEVVGVSELGRVEEGATELGGVEGSAEELGIFWQPARRPTSVRSPKSFFFISAVLLSRCQKYKKVGDRCSTSFFQAV